jgi:hypothetical protein
MTYKEALAQFRREYFTKLLVACESAPPWQRCLAKSRRRMMSVSRRGPRFNRGNAVRLKGRKRWHVVRSRRLVPFLGWYYMLAAKVDKWYTETELHRTPDT